MKNAVLVPSAAVQFGVNGTFVYVMEGDKKVRIRQLKTGPSDENSTVITEGLAAGDRVVLEGTDRLKDGSEVEVVNSRLFILRPVATSLLMVAILLVGIVAYTAAAGVGAARGRLPDHPGQTLYPGASPDVMTSSVTAPLERQFGQMPGLNQMTSTSSGGASVITLQFNLDLSSTSPSRRCRPPSMPRQSAAVRPAGAADLRQGQPGRRADPDAGGDLQDHAAAQGARPGRHAAGAEDLAAPGVGLVSLSGGQRPAVRIQVNPRAGRLRPEPRRRAHHIGNANVNTPKGNFDGPTRASTINANDQLKSPTNTATSSSPTQRRAGALRTWPTWSTPRRTSAGAWANSTPAVIVNIQRQPGANVIEVVDRIKACCRSCRPACRARSTCGADRPHHHHPRLGRDVGHRTAAVDRAGGDGDLRLPAHIRATIIPSVAVPLSLVGTARRHVHGRLLLNNLSLMALTIATGFVVDDAIVMIENIRATSRRAYAAAGGAEGRQQIGFTIILADRLADRGADPAAVHGRRGRPAVPRIRRHAGGHHPDLGGGLADADADDVRRCSSTCRKSEQGLSSTPAAPSSTG
jgi:multidrug efflux pump